MNSQGSVETPDISGQGPWEGTHPWTKGSDSTGREVGDYPGVEGRGVRSGPCVDGKDTELVEFSLQCVCSATQWGLTLRDPRSPPGSPVHGIFQTRILEQVAISYSSGSSRPRTCTHMSCVSCIGRRILYHYTPWEALISVAGPRPTGLQRPRVSCRLPGKLCSEAEQAECDLKACCLATLGLHRLN